MKATYYLIQQKTSLSPKEVHLDERTTYGKRLIEQFSRRLTQRFGRGFSSTNLRYFWQFFQAYQSQNPIIHWSGGKLDSPKKLHPAGGQSDSSPGYQGPFPLIHAGVFTHFLFSLTTQKRCPQRRLYLTELCPSRGHTRNLILFNMGIS